jgi:uncharacterized membrane protein YfcA
MSSLVIVLISIVAGVLGAILGLGGGIIVIPALTLFFGIDIRYAIGASIVSVIATSSGAAARYVRDHLTNIRLAIFLEIATTTGAVCGAVISSYLRSQYLFLLFSLMLIHSAFMMWKRDRQLNVPAEATVATGHAWAHKLKLNSKYPDYHLGKDVEYLVENVPLGFIYMFAAGMLSALLGIGSGILKVLAMDSAMKLPIKVSSATSNFMIGVTAAASAGAYYMKGDILPEIAAPVAIGVLIGSFFGAQLMQKMKSTWIRRIFIFVLLVVAAQMGLKGLGM